METFLSVEELAALFKLAEQTIRKWVLLRKIPFVKIGKAVRFRPSEIERWVNGGGMAACTANDEGVQQVLFAETGTPEAGG